MAAGNRLSALRRRSTAADMDEWPQACDPGFFFSAAVRDWGGLGTASVLHSSRVSKPRPGGADAFVCRLKRKAGVAGLRKSAGRVKWWKSVAWIF